MTDSNDCKVISSSYVYISILSPCRFPIASLSTLKLVAHVATPNHLPVLFFMQCNIGYVIICMVTTCSSPRLWSHFLYVLSYDHFGAMNIFFSKILSFINSVLGLKYMLIVFVHKVVTLFISITKYCMIPQNTPFLPLRIV